MVKVYKVAATPMRIGLNTE